MADGVVTSVVARTASFSRDRRYRYRLTRTWNAREAPLVWVMLNPSAADDVDDDPTTRRVMALSRGWGFGGCEVVNLFGFRTHRPLALAVADDPVGPRNGTTVGAALVAAAPAGVVVVGWGCTVVPGVSVAAAGRAMLRRVGRAGLRAVAVGHNRDGSPRHPLYVPGGVRPVTFERRQGSVG